MSFDRKRKTKAPCAGCRLHRDLCICASQPLLTLRTRVLLLIHHRELKRTTNTGVLALRCLTNQAIFVRGQDRQPLDLRPHLDQAYRAAILFPREGATELNPDWVSADPRPVCLIVPDGNWRQASKVPARHPELRDLPRVRLPDLSDGRPLMRLETVTDGMPTMLAIAHALRILEGEEFGRPLVEFYERKRAATWIGRRGGARATTQAF